MTTDITTLLQTLFEKNYTHLDLIHLVPIPKQADRMLRFKHLQEIFENFEEQRTSDTHDYLLQIKPKQTLLTEPSVTPWEAPENIYLPNQKLNIPFLFRNADLLFHCGEWHAAKTIYKTILNTGESKKLALYRLARCLEAEEKWDDALYFYEESIAYQPNLDCFQRIAHIYFKKNDDLQAALTLQRALKLKDLSENTRFQLHQSLGNSWTRLQRYNDAEKHFKKALELNPSAEEVRTNLGILALHQDQLTEAKRYFQEATTAQPNHIAAITGLGSCALLEQNLQLAHDYFARALNLQLNNPSAIFYLVKCAYELKSYTVAEKFLSQYIQIAPIHPNLLYSLSGLQFHLGKLDEALQTTHQILRLQPQHPGAQELIQLIQRNNAHSV